MAKSMIHISPIKANSETHNLRKKEYKHVRQDLTFKNFSWIGKQINPTKKELEILVKEKTGRKMQKKATPLREGVFLIEERHTNQEILQVLQGIEAKFGIKPIQLHIHRDEGHWIKKNEEGEKLKEEFWKWKPNLHAHVVFEWIDRKTGKSFKLNRDDLSELQTYFAENLGMERGQKSTRKHLNALEWKVEASSDELDYLELKKAVTEAEIDDLTENNNLLSLKKAKLFDELLKKDIKFKKIIDKYLEPSLEPSLEPKKQRKKGKKM